MSHNLGPWLHRVLSHRVFTRLALVNGTIHQNLPDHFTWKHMTDNSPRQGCFTSALDPNIYGLGLWEVC